MSQPNIEVAVGVHDGKVVMKFSENINYLELDHENCFQIAEAMTSAAFESRDGVKPVGETLKASLIEKHKEKLVPRIALMLSSIEKLSNGQKAIKIIDVVFAEIF
jgi:hypothetical protein